MDLFSKFKRKEHFLTNIEAIIILEPKPEKDVTKKKKTTYQYPS